MSRKTPNRFGSGVRGYKPFAVTPSKAEVQRIANVSLGDRQLREVARAQSAEWLRREREYIEAVRMHTRPWHRLGTDGGVVRNGEHRIRPGEIPARLNEEYNYQADFPIGVAGVPIGRVTNFVVQGVMADRVAARSLAEAPAVSLGIDLANGVDYTAIEEYVLASMSMSLDELLNSRLGAAAIAGRSFAGSLGMSNQPEGVLSFSEKRPPHPEAGSEVCTPRKVIRSLLGVVVRDTREVTGGIKRESELAKVEINFKMRKKT